jgi:hypothetical protein
VDLSFFNKMNGGDPSKLELHADEMVDPQEGSYVQNSSNRNGRGRVRSVGTVFRIIGL